MGVHLGQGPGLSRHLLPRKTRLARHDQYLPEKTLLAFADHGSLEDLLEPDYAAAERTVASVADERIDVDALGQSLQRQGAKAFAADWAALLEAIDTRITGIRSAV
jgi:transaldolase